MAEQQEEMRSRANTIVKHHAAMAAGFGMMPVPYADLAAVVAVQINMMRELSALYGTPFEKERGRAVIAGLLGGGLPFAASGLPLIGSTLKLVPVVGSVLGAAIMPGLSTATTLALGRIFTNHFEAGGSLLDFNVAAMRKAFKGEMAKAKEEAPDIEAEAARTAGTPSAA